MALKTKFSTGIIIAIGTIIFKEVASQCPSNITILNGYRFTRIDFPTTNPIAIDNCYLRHTGGYLVLIQTNESADAVEQITRGCSDTFYIGLEYKTNAWYWNDDTLLTDTQSRWQSGEGELPSGACAWVSSLSQTWIDGECSTLHGYICQTELLRMTSISDAWTLLGKNVILTVGIYSVDGPVNITVFKNPTDDNNGVVICKEFNVDRIQFECKITNATSSDTGTYIFVGTRDGYERSATTNLYVQDPAVIISEIPEQISSPVTQGPGNISCDGSGIPLPTVEWTRNGIAIDQNQSSGGVYQTISHSKSLLHFDDAVSSDDGPYFCSATNVIGSANTVYSDTKQTTLRVFGSPSIKDINATLCAGNEMTVALFWIPNNQTLGITHRIEVNSTSSNRVANETPTDDSVMKTEIEGLDSRVQHEIKITVCPDTCIEKLSDNKTFSATKADPVTNATVVESNEIPDTSVCTVSWMWNGTSYPGSDVIFKVNQSSTLNMREPATQNYVTNTSGTSFIAFTQPNRNYTFDIYVSNCAGDSIGTRALGQCITDVAAPIVIQPISTDSSGIYTATTQQIVIPIPDESNGLISCLFILGKQGGESVDTVSWSDLQMLSATSGSAPSDGVDYIAVAIRMSDVYDQTSYAVVLGDDRVTSCDVYQLSNSRNQKQTSVINGKNWALLNGMTYSVATVSTTPSSSGEVFIKQSENVSFEHEYVEVAPIWWIVLAAIGASLLIVFIGLMVWYAKLTWCHSKDDLEENPYASGKGPVDMAPTTTTPAFATSDSLSNKLLSSPKLTSATAIPLDDLLQRFKSFSENEGQNFVDEFEDLKAKSQLLDLSCTVGSAAELKKKNRYKNVLPYDHSRVHLSSGRGVDIDSYINASYINGFEIENKFIATQGPLPSTIDDFWQMIIEQRPRVIVMATNLVENGKTKCERYWPDVSSSKVYGRVNVLTVSESDVGGYKRRIFQLSDRFSSHTVVHLQYMDWPDHGIPISTSTFIRFYEACVQASGNSTEPIIVHCSAGAGRTGTIIAYDYLIREASQKGAVDIFECVMKMRAQRMDMVQNCDQYKFIYRLLTEYHLFNDSDLDADMLYATPSLNNPTNYEIERQLKKLDLASSLPKIAFDKVSFLLNVSVTWRPEDGENIARFNAVRIETYEDKFHLIASAPPTKSTAETFWRLNLDNDVSFIVSITDSTTQSKDNINECWPSEENIKREFGSVTVDLSVAEEKRHYQVRDLFVRRDSSLQTKEIRQYKIMKWKPKVALNVIRDVNESCQRFSGTKKPRVLVHCRRGFGESGSFCALINLVARLETERRIDVFRTVKDLRDANTVLVENVKQYKFCYDALKCCGPVKSKGAAGGVKSSHNNTAYASEPMTTTL